MDIIRGILIVIIIVVSVLGILLVLVQSSRGSGGLFGDTGGSQSVIGSDRRGDFFSKVTSIFLGIFLGGSLLLAYLAHVENAGIAPPSSDVLIEDEADTKGDIEVEAEKTESTKQKLPEINIDKGEQGKGGKATEATNDAVKNDEVKQSVNESKKAVEDVKAKEQAKEQAKGAIKGTIKEKAKSKQLKPNVKQTNKPVKKTIKNTTKENTKENTKSSKPLRSEKTSSKKELEKEVEKK